MPFGEARPIQGDSYKNATGCARFLVILMSSCVRLVSRSDPDPIARPPDTSTCNSFGPDA
jgi:hypothetical protein